MYTKCLGMQKIKFSVNFIFRVKINENPALFFAHIYLQNMDTTIINQSIIR